jgi:hypothetical protein
VRHFCESVHTATGTPEYFAAVSSLIISALALVSLFAGEGVGAFNHSCMEMRYSYVGPPCHRPSRQSWRHIFIYQLIELAYGVHI